MPTDIKKLMRHGQPIGARLMHNAITNEPYYKFNGLEFGKADWMATYLVCIPREERKEILERMLMSCRMEMLQKILSQYQDKARQLMHKNNYRVEAHVPLVCDQLGIIH